MIVWIDAHISPAFAPWLARRFRVEARRAADDPARDVGPDDRGVAARWISVQSAEYGINGEVAGATAAADGVIERPREGR